MVAPSKKLALVGFFSTIPLHLILIALFPDMNYFVRAFFVIMTGLGIVSFSTFKTGWQTWRKLYVSGSSRLTYYAVALLFSLVALHVIFH
jgi:SSS family solute:Na+ symporter